MKKSICYFIQTVLFFTGFLWCLPVTCLAILFLTLMIGFRQIDSGFLDVNDFISVYNFKRDSWFQKNVLEKRRLVGFSFGALAFIEGTGCDLASVFKDTRTINHERRHCFHWYVLGVFFILVYPLNSVFVYLFQKSKHSYFDNWFERDARKSAGQQLDIPKSQWSNGPEDRWIWW